MGSGFKREVINPRERAISTDINRAQAFAASDAATVGRLRQLAKSSVASSGGLAALDATTATPLLGEVEHGLTVRPQLGGALTLVEPGVAWVINPDGTPQADDSPCKMVNDPGVTDGTTLLLPANASGSTLIGVVECSRVDTVLETDNRDIFDPGTGLFAPAVVNKVVAARFQYRIRTMALAGGFAGSAGWMPLAIFLQPNAVNAWDTIEMWDVRPLASDRAVPEGRISRADVSGGGADINAKPSVRDVYINVENIGGPGNVIVGTCEVVGANGRYLGGQFLQQGGSQLNYTWAELTPTGYSFGGATGVVNYLYLCTPYGLPRWCKYGTAAIGTGLGGRAPGRLRGLPVVSTTMTAGGWYSNAITPVTMPSSWNTAPVCVPLDTACVWTFLSAPGPTFPLDITTDGTVTWQNPAENVAVGDVTGGGATTQLVNFDFVGNTHYPNNARAIWVQVDVEYGINVPSPGTAVVEAFSLQPGTNRPVAKVLSQAHQILAGGIFVRHDLFRVPVDPKTGNTGTFTTRVEYDHNGAAFAYVAAPTIAVGRVVGWEI